MHPGSNDVFELDDSEFQRLEPTNKITLPKQTATAAPKPVSTDAMHVATGEVSVEVTPAPQTRPTSSATQTTLPGHGAKNARQALQDALAQLQKSKLPKPLPSEATPAIGRPPSTPTLARRAGTTLTDCASHQPARVNRSLARCSDAAGADRPGGSSRTACQGPARSLKRPRPKRAIAGPPPAAARVDQASPPRKAVSFEEDLTPLPSQAPWQAAITSEIALMPSQTSAPADAPGPPQADTPGAASDWGGNATTEMEAPPSMDFEATPSAQGPIVSAAFSSMTLAELDFTTAPSGPSASTNASAPLAAASLEIKATPRPPHAAEAPPPAAVPRPSLSEQARLAKQPAFTAPTSSHVAFSERQISPPWELKPRATRPAVSATLTHTFGPWPRGRESPRYDHHRGSAQRGFTPSPVSGRAGLCLNGHLRPCLGRRGA